MMDNFLISDGLLTPEIVKSLPSLVCVGHSRLVRQGELAGDSPSLSSFTGRVYDAFTDGEHTSNPAWTVEARMTYIAFTSPGAEAPPPLEGGPFRALIRGV